MSENNIEYLQRAIDGAMNGFCIPVYERRQQVPASECLDMFLNAVQAAICHDCEALGVDKKRINAMINSQNFASGNL